MRQEELRRRLFGIAQQGDIPKFTAEASQLLDMPLTVMDAACVVIAKHPIEAQEGCGHWNAYRPAEQVDSDLIHTAWKEGHMDRLSASDVPVLIDWGFAAAEPRLTQELRWQGSPVGYLLALTAQGDYTAEQEEGVALAAEMLTFMLAMHGQHFQAHTTFANALFLGLLSGTLDTQEKVDALAETSRITLSGRFVTVSVQGREAGGVDLGELMAHLWRPASSNVLPHFDGDTLYLLVGGLRGPFHQSAQCADIVSFVKRADLCCGVSRPFDSVLQLKGHRWEADKALELGRAQDPSTRMHHFGQHVLKAIVQAAAQGVPAQVLVHPALAEIRAYDRQHGTELLETLRAYLFSSRDVKQASEELHVHKNTLWYRLDRIREIAHVDLNDAGSNVLLHLGLIYEEMNGGRDDVT